MGAIDKLQEYTKSVLSAKEEFLSQEPAIDKTSTISNIVDLAAQVKKEADSLAERLENFKKFFKSFGTPGEHFSGTHGYVSLMSRASATVEPKDLKNMLESIGRPAEFVDMVTVKVADARKKLGTMLFDKIATTIPNASITVKIGSK